MLSTLIALVKLRVIQVVFSYEEMFVLQPHLEAKLCAGGGLKLALGSITNSAKEAL